jgi:superfamily II DNA or RNA helicase
VRLCFDRGTLLLLDPPPRWSGRVLPGALWDPRVRAFRCPAHLLKHVTEALAAAGVQFSDEVSGARLGWPRSGHVDEAGRGQVESIVGGSASPIKPTAARAVELRPYQQAALTAWQLAGRRGIVVLPTGSGKTRLAVAAILDAAMPALCLVPTRVLLDQWARAVEELAGRTPGRFGDGERALAPITVATFESAWRYMDRIGNRFGLLVVDEAHHFGGGIRDEALEMCIAAVRLGLSATPPPGAAGERLGALLGPVVYELSVSSLAGTFLAPFENVVIHVDLDPAERAEYDRLERTFRDVMTRFRRFHPGATWDEFARAAARTDEGRRAIVAFHRARRLLAFPSAKRAALGRLLDHHREARTLVFVGDNQTAYAVAREHLVMPLTCDITRKERERALALFRNGKLRALVSAQVLNEGLDVPDAEVGIVVAGRGGEREHVQRIGRLLRPRAGKRALVYELVVRGTREVRDARRRHRALAA